MADLLKNRINSRFVTQLAKDIEAHSKAFDSKKFVRAVQADDWNDLELKQRIRRVVQCLSTFLPGSYPHQLKALEKVAPQVTGLAALIFPDFVEVYGLEDWDISIAALKQFTTYSTSEFAIRPYIQKDPQKMMRLLKEWSKDKNEHVRRLSSEGCRPLLPWSFKLRELVKDPAPILLILENLKADESLYVRKSVANNLNDISKNHPELVLELAQRWKGQNANTDWILKHALRTLLKRGDQRALKIFGVGTVKKVEIAGLKFSEKKFKIGGQLEFNFEISNHAKESQMLRLEYAIHYIKKNGARSKKVFKLTERNFEKGRLKITKRHSLKQMTTRVHYPGKHRLELIVNGNVLSQGEFILV